MSGSLSPEEIVLKAENDDKLRWGHQRATLFLEAVKIFDQAGNCEKAQELFWDSILFNLEILNYDGKKDSKERFAPKVEYTDGSVFPDKTLFTKEQVEYYKKRVGDIKNPITKVRYYDIVWELEKDHISARNAIDAYLECVPIYLENDWESEVADSLTRAAELSRTLNDLKRIEIVKKAILETIEKLAFEKKFRYILELTDAALDSKRHYKEETYISIIKYVQEAIKFYKTEMKDGFHLERSFLSKLVDLKKTTNKTEESKRHREEIAESYEREAEWKFTNYPHGAHVSATIIQEAIQSYSNIGNSEKVEELKILLKQRTGIAVEHDIKTIVTTVEIPKKAIDALIEPLLTVSSDEALEKIASYDSLIPNIERIRKDVEEQKKIAPLGFYIPRVSIRDENPVHTSTTQDELFDEHVRKSVVRFYMIGGIILNNVFDTLLKEKSISADDLTSFLDRSDLYDEEKLNLINIGLVRYFEEDYVSSIHILVPQIESVLRKVLGKLGKPTTTFREGMVQERTLDDIMRVEDIKKHLGENVWYYLKVLLVDKIGDNLRNDVSHGLITYDRCTKNIAIIVIHVMMILTRF